MTVAQILFIHSQGIEKTKAANSGLSYIKGGNLCPSMKIAL
jgi:hypothetical protein